MPQFQTDFVNLWICNSLFLTSTCHTFSMVQALRNCFKVTKSKYLLVLKISALLQNHTYYLEYCSDFLLVLWSKNTMGCAGGFCHTVIHIFDRFWVCIIFPDKLLNVICAKKGKLTFCQLADKPYWQYQTLAQSVMQINLQITVRNTKEPVL